MKMASIFGFTDVGTDFNLYSNSAGFLLPFADDNMQKIRAIVISCLKQQVVSSTCRVYSDSVDNNQQQTHRLPVTVQAY